MGCSYRDLIVWQKATTMVTKIYRATQGFPREEMFGLTSQLRRSAGSVASNMAEGQGRLSKGGVPAVSRASTGLADRDGNSACDSGKLGLSELQYDRGIDRPLRGSKPPSTRADEVSSTSRTYGKN